MDEHARTARAHRPPHAAWLKARDGWGPGVHEDGFGLRPSDEVDSPAGFAASDQAGDTTVRLCVRPPRRGRKPSTPDTSWSLPTGTCSQCPAPMSTTRVGEPGE